MDKFSLYLMAYPTTNQDTKTITTVIINIVTKHASLLVTILSAKDWPLHPKKARKDSQGIVIKHVKTKHAPTNGKLEERHSSFKKALKVETGERSSMWHQCVNIAVLNYNTSYHTRIWCEPSKVFHGRFLYQIVDLEIGNRPQKKNRYKLPEISFSKQK